MATRKPLLHKGDHKMKPLILALALVTNTALAVSAGSIWDGEQFDLGGYQLIQDSKTKSDFYWLPKKFRIKKQSTLHEDGTVTNTPMASHAIVTKDDGDYSVYNFTLILDQLPKMKTIDADFLLKRRFGSKAELKGMLPACGLKFDTPKIFGSSSTSNKITVTFGLSESPGCSQAQVPKEFNMTVEAPVSMEPALRTMVISKAGLPLPQIIYHHPSTYSDDVSMTIDALSFWENMSKEGGLSGSYKQVELGLKRKVKETLQTLSFTSQMVFDIKEADPVRKEAMRKHYEDIFIDILTKTYFHFQGITPAAHEDVTVATQNGKTGNYVAATFGMSEAEAKRKDKIVISMKNVNYSTIQSQLTIDITGSGLTE